MYGCDARAIRRGFARRRLPRLIGAVVALVSLLQHGMLAISLLCAIVVIVVVLFTNIGNEFRPTV